MADMPEEEAIQDGCRPIGSVQDGCQVGKSGSKMAAAGGGSMQNGCQVRKSGSKMAAMAEGSIQDGRQVRKGGSKMAAELKVPFKMAAARGVGVSRAWRGGVASRVTGMSRDGGVSGACHMTQACVRRVT